jgi:hypothetical protein
MSLLRVDPTALTALAGHCRSLAAGLDAQTPPPEPINTWQPSALAVQNVHAGVSRARTALVNRMRETAAGLDTTAAAFVAEDDGSADRLNAPSDRS